jgi:hypothetical protein
MIKTLFRIFLSIISKVSITANLAMENLALRQQLAILKRTCKRPQLQPKNRLFWVLLSRLWCRWREVLIIVKPETVVRWHKQGFKLFWNYKSRHKGRVGKSRLNKEIRSLVRRMARANPLWGAPRIHGELLKLGIKISERTVSNLMPPRAPKPPSQTWRAFLTNHMHNTCSIDFFTIPTATFKILLVIIRHDRRKVVHFNVTTNPSAKWTAQQLVEAFPWDTGEPEESTIK